MTLERMLREREILNLMGWSRSTLRRRIREGKFPPPVMASQRMGRWFETTVAKHQDEIRKTAGEAEAETAIKRRTKIGRGRSGEDA